MKTLNIADGLSVLRCLTVAEAGITSCSFLVMDRAIILTIHFLISISAIKKLAAS